MGVRTSHDVGLKVGRNNSLALGDLVADVDIVAQLDTLARAAHATYDLAAGETGVQVDFGDVAEARLVYIEADGEIQVTPGAPGAATAAEREGSLGTFPTGFTGGETASFDVDNFGTVLVTFTSAAQLLADVRNEINAAFALAGFLSGGLPYAPARDNGLGELLILSPTTGASSEVEVVAGGTALAALGLTAGVNAIPGQTPLQLYRPCNTGSSTLSVGVKSFLCASMRTTSLTLDNLDTANSVSVTVVVAGDVLSEPPAGV